MLPEALAAVAAAGGVAVAQAVGTDTWHGVRHAVARLWRYRDGEQQQVALERLDETATVLAQASGEDAQVRQAVVWQVRLENLLEALDEADQQTVVEELRALVDQGRREVSPEGQTVGAIRMEAEATGRSRVYQAGRDQHIQE
ncbi:hypothetical protein [Streptomyces coeruleorubidus]|uniref:hypothetical protein n=1 Tax=Streptomyces coeruleorubidus TaxID=116188 RepID=UPI0018767C76|nr:hypothetical protein [Streptomyces bellus]GGU46911.1 hypothetical protein GCM10010244_85730 [Streptomyces bellus]